MTLTDEQAAIVHCEQSLFVSACAGAGKTKVVIERARHAIQESGGRGMAFLSFTNAAVDELEARLRAAGLIDVAAFPHFIGTFDRFLWHFFVAPFGLPGFDGIPRLIDDLEQRLVGPPFKRQLPLSLFDARSGKLKLEEAGRHGFDTADLSLVGKYEDAAARALQAFRQRGEIGYAQVRQLAAQRISDPVFGGVLARAISARFLEFVVDETQDCNLEDLSIIRWLREAGVVLKVLCDPNQAIFEFRGGAGEHLGALASDFPNDARRVLTGNFRSSSAICAAVSALRPSINQPPDKAVGENAGLTIPVHLVAYTGAINQKVGDAYRAICADHRLSPETLPLVAATRESAMKAAGCAEEYQGDKMSLQLALAVDLFYRGTHAGNLLEALDAMHRVVLRIGGHLESKTYRQYLVSSGTESAAWRPKVVEILRALAFELFSDAHLWLSQARMVLSPYLKPGGRTIAQVLSYSPELAALHAPRPHTNLVARTIHSVKGLEFPAICVLLTTNKARGIVDHLLTGEPKELAEHARKIYVGASRARKLLVIALPKSQVNRLRSRLEAFGVPIALTVVGGG